MSDRPRGPRIGSRSGAADYDRENAFFFEDLEELRASGYLAPRSLLETARDQRLLAAHAPATALGINMHLVWVGVARVLHERGYMVCVYTVDADLTLLGCVEAGLDAVTTDVPARLRALLLSRR